MSRVLLPHGGRVRRAPSQGGGLLRLPKPRLDRSLEIPSFVLAHLGSGRWASVIRVCPQAQERTSVLPVANLPRAILINRAHFELINKFFQN